MPGTVGWLVCTAHRTDGTPCRAPVVRGARVCRAHGGLAGHVRDAARRRLETLVDPAIGTLRSVMLRGETDTVRLKAAESILDRAGIVNDKAIEVDNQVTVTVSYEDVALAQSIVDVPHQVIEQVALNGHSNGHEKTAPQDGDSVD